MDNFQRQLSRLKHNRIFASTFNKKRPEAEVALQIRRLRESKGWSQQHVAKKVGCSQQAISAVEQAGYRRHSLPLLHRIAAVLDADVVVALIPKRAAASHQPIRQATRVEQTSHITKRKTRGRALRCFDAAGHWEEMRDRRRRYAA